MNEAEELRQRIEPKDEAAGSSAASLDTDEASLLDEESLTHQPPCLPEFPPRFRDSLEDLPTGVIRSALVLIGKLAAGEANAFASVRRLRRD